MHIVEEILWCVSLTCVVGMLSKSKGQILRVAAVLQVLFHVDNPHNIPAKVGEDVMKAAISHVDLCIQHAAYITGRGRVQDEVESVYQIMQGVKALIVCIMYSCFYMQKVCNIISGIK